MPPMRLDLMHVFGNRRLRHINAVSTLLNHRVRVARKGYPGAKRTSPSIHRRVPDGAPVRIKLRTPMLLKLRYKWKQYNQTFARTAPHSGNTRRRERLRDACVTQG